LTKGDERKGKKKEAEKPTYKFAEKGSFPSFGWQEKGVKMAPLRTEERKGGEKQDDEGKPHEKIHTPPAGSPEF